MESDREYTNREILIMISEQNASIIEQNDKVLEMMSELANGLMEAVTGEQEMIEKLQSESGAEQADILSQAFQKMIDAEKEPELEFPAWGAPLKKKD